MRRVEACSHDTLGRLVNQSNEMWNRRTAPDAESDEIRYLEIGAVGLQDDTYLLERISIAEAPSRARMVLRAGDLVLSTTRPHRGAIARIHDEDAGAIASTGFAILRNPDAERVSRDFLLAALLSDCVLTQMLQRSSGGAYPAITPEELDRVCIPTPPPDVQACLVAALDAARAARREKLAQADALLSGLDAFVLDAMGLSLPLPDGHRSTYAVRIGDVRTAKKLYPDYFHPERINAIRAVESRYTGDRATTLLGIADFVRDQRNVEPDDDYLGLANVQPNTGERIESNEEDGKGNCSRYAEGDVLFARLRPYLNKVFRAESDGVCSTEFHVIRVRRDEQGKPLLIPDYLAVVLRSSLVLAQTRHMMTGNTHPRLANEDVVNLVVPVPDVKDQEKIAAEVVLRREEARRLREEALAIWGDAKRRFEEELLGPKPGAEEPKAGGAKGGRKQ